MNPCIDCGTELPAGARFCGNCGKVQNPLSSEQFTKYSEPRLQAVFPAGADPMATLIQEKNRPHPSMPAPPAQGDSNIRPPGQVSPEGEHEQRKAALLDAAAFAPGSQPQAPHLPVVQGAPSIHNAPVIQGSPQSVNPLPPAHFSSGSAAHMAAPPAPAGAVGSPVPGHPGIPQFPGGAPPHISPVGAPGNVVPPSGNPYQPGFQQPPSYPGSSPYHTYPPHQYAGQPGPAAPAGTGQFGYTTGHAAHAGQAAATKAAGGIATKFIIIIVAAVVAVGGGAAALAYVVTRPQPLISITSQYTLNKLPVGSTGTRLHFTGQQFANNSAITFLLDNNPAPGGPAVLSDQHGNVRADLIVTTDWSPGLHTLTARDASNNTSQKGVQIRIVPQGQAHTPGPAGAPPDDSSFKIAVQENGQYDGSGSFTRSEQLIVSGHPDPAGGSVCKANDTGKPIHSGGLKTSNGIPYSEDITLTCSGTYQSGSLVYTETLNADVITLNTDGGVITCHLKEARVFEIWSGSYNASGSFTGTITYPSIPQDNFSCTTGSYDSFYFYYYSGNATWTGTPTLS